MALRNALSRLTQAGYAYALINTLVSVIAFGRNFLFMKTLGLADVGQIAMMQTIIMLVGFVQLGTMNGAFILFAEQKADQTRRIVTLLSWGIAALFAMTAAAALAGAGSLFAPLIAPETLIIGCFAGIATLASTWMNNLLIAKGALGRSNIINVVAVLVSLALALLSSDYGLGAALLSILAQPLLVACGALLIDREVRPSITGPDADTLQKVLALGFMPFLAAILVLGTYQLERWSIAWVLGEEALGSFYLVMMYMAFFALVPTALYNVSFPRSIRAFQAGTLDEFASIRRRHLAEILTYCAVAIIGTATLLPPIVGRLLPEYLSSVNLTFLALPAVLIFTLRDNASLVLYSLKKTRPILTSGAILFVSYAVLLAGAAVFDLFTLSVVVILRAVAVLISTAYLYRARGMALRGLL